MMISKNMALILGIGLGLLLLVIGSGTHNSNLMLAGDFIFAAVMIWGGLNSDEPSIPLRVALLAIGGLFVISAFAGTLGLASLLTR
jgi:hypothetical protein